ncbi:MAG: hypothetical protein C0501_21490 [Isosphaera sp.]|nr:hypothetical protein [Isosphaera sp.]
MRRLAALVLFAATGAGVVTADPAGQEPKAKQPEKKAQPKADPKTFIPDAATLQTIKDKTEQLRKAVEGLKAKKLPDDVLVEVEIYLKAAENIVRFEEWLHASSVKWALQTLDQGLDRAKQADGGKAVWRDAPGRWVVRAYRSDVDNSIQPYAVQLPHDYGKDPKKKWRLDIVLHGRDGALTEAKFIATHNGVAPKDRDFIQLEVYGRGNNAYRWAGETDVWEARMDFEVWATPAVDRQRVVLRGFSMGGAGTWHIGLHHPGTFCVIGPGAGFTTTHGYIANLPKELPDYQEKCLRIYDAVGYAENAFNVPVVAYSGEKDAQKKAADNIENALKGFKEPLRFTHLVAPGLEHQMPAEWQAKAEAEYRKYADKGRDRTPGRVRFVTYTTMYGDSGDGVSVNRLERQYEKAVIDVRTTPEGVDVRTTNVAEFDIPAPDAGDKPRVVVVDGQKLGPTHAAYFAKRDGTWSVLWNAPTGLAKRGLCGPIDAAFMGRFTVVGPGGAGWHAAPSKHVAAELTQFAKVWDRYFRGTLPTPEDRSYDARKPSSLVLFGDPQSNPLIAKVLPQLPITWTKEKLVVNGVQYDPKTHLPVLIYPDPLKEKEKETPTYVVLNCGHTFREADLKGTNANLYPRLGDWAVIKPTPTDKDPAAFEVVAAGLFDENWQFPKKK